MKFPINPVLWTSTYDPTLNNNTQNITVIAVNVQSGAEGTSRTIGMQNTGIPVNYLIIAILMVLGSLIGKKRK